MIMVIKSYAYHILFELIIRLGHKLNFARVLPPKSKCEYKPCPLLAIVFIFHKLCWAGKFCFMSVTFVCMHTLHTSVSQPVS